MIRTHANTRDFSGAVPFDVPAAVGWAVNRLRLWLAVARQRRQLAGLDARQLEDIGLSAEAAGREAARPFWDAPAHWCVDSRKLSGHAL